VVGIPIAIFVNAYFSLAIAEIISHFQSLAVPFAYCPMSTAYFSLAIPKIINQFSIPCRPLCLLPTFRWPSLKSSANFQSLAVPFAYCLLFAGHH
jgi:hypothetical protein